MTDTRSIPGRPRTFDRNDVLDRVVELFWDQGYKGTTFADVERATGLHRQSLVYAFGGKRSLFLEALRRYRARHVGKLIGLLSAEGAPSDNIRAAFAFWLKDARRTAGAGCLMVNTAGEFGCSDAEISELIGQASDDIIAAFTEVFARARESGEVTGDLAPEAMANLAVACGDGALLRARAAADPTLAKSSFDALLDRILS